MDLRDAKDEQVPWRAFPERPVGPLPVRILDAGRTGGAAVALLDLGSAQLRQKRYADAEKLFRGK